MLDGDMVMKHYVSEAGSASIFTQGKHPLGLAVLSNNTNFFPDDLWLTHFTLITV